MSMGFYTVRYFAEEDLKPRPITWMDDTSICEEIMPEPREARLPVVAYRDGTVTVRWPDGRLQDFHH
jgi:hypothetical protein